MPQMRRIGFLVDAATPRDSRNRYVEFARRTATRLSVEAYFAEATKVEDVEGAIAILKKNGAEAMMTLPSGWFEGERERITKLALANRLPLAGGAEEWAESGALLGFGADRSASYRRAAYYVDRILKGAKPGDLPIEQPTKFKLGVNMKTARALGITIPQSILMRADRVIE